MGNLITAGIVIFSLCAAFLSLNSPPKSFAQSSNNTQDFFAGKWINNNQNATISQATIARLASDDTRPSYISYSVELTGMCQLFPCSWSHLDNYENGIAQNYLTGVDNFCGTNEFSGHNFKMTISPTEGANIELTIDEYSCVSTVPTIVYFPPQLLHSYTVGLTKSTSDQGPSTPNCTSSQYNLTTALATSNVTILSSSITQINVYLNASKTNGGDLVVVVAPRVFPSGTSTEVQSTIEASVSTSDFFISPGQQIVLPITIRSSNSPVGDYKVKIDTIAKDPYRCLLAVQPLEVPLLVRPPPNFTISVSDPSLLIQRGIPSSVAYVKINAINGTAAPLKMSYVSQWDTAAKPSPSNATVNFAPTQIILDPGQSQNASLQITAPSIDNPNLAGPYYTGNFTYTITAIGTWNETATVQRTIVKKLDIPVSITEQPFDFKIASDKQIVYLLPKEAASLKISVEYLGGRHFPVALQVEGLTLGMTIRLDKHEGIGNYTSVMTIDPVNFNFGHRELEVRAEGGGVTRLLPFTISQSPFKVLVDHSAISLPSPGQSTALTVSVTPNIEDYKSRVRLSAQSLLKEGSLNLRFEDVEGIPPFSTILHISTPATGASGLNSTEVVLNATDGQFTEKQTISILPQIQIDLEPRLDSLNLDSVPLSKNQLPLIISTASPEGDHIIFAQPEINLGSGTKFVFTGWNDGVKSNERILSSQISSLTIVGKYSLQYYLNVTSAYGNVKGGGWYNNGTTATIGLPSQVSTNSGAKEEFVDWTGPSAPFVGQACESEGPLADQEKSIVEQKTAGNYLICMNRPHTLVASWKMAEDHGTNNNIMISILGGGAVAAIAGTFAYLKFLRPSIQKIPGTEQLLDSQPQSFDSNQSTNNTNQQKPQQRNFPILQWHIYASNVIRSKGRTFVDVLIENVGEVDVRKIKIDVTCPSGIQYDGGTVLIDLLLAHESRKVSFSLRHIDDLQQGPFEVTLALGYEFLTKFVRRNDEKKVTLDLKPLHVGLFRPSIIANSGPEIKAFNAVKAWLQDKGIGVKEIDISDLDQNSAPALSIGVISLIMSVRTLSKSTRLTDYVLKQTRAGFSVLLYSAGQDDDGHENPAARTEEYRRIAELIGFSTLDIHELQLDRGFGLRVLNAEHPITRNYYGNDIFRIANQEGDLLTGSIAEGTTVLVEQLGIFEGEKELKSIPSILTKNTESNGVVIYLNIPIEPNIWVLSYLLDRTLLFASKMLQ